MRKVLIVEDDRQLNDTLKGLVLKVRDTEVIQAHDRTSAETALRLSGTFALMVVDVKLGDDPREKLSGFTLLKMLNGMPTVAIVVSGMPDDMLSEFSISLQAFDFIGKPINPMDFVHKVELALSMHEQLLRDVPPDVAPSAFPVGLTADPKRKLGLCWKTQPVMLTMTQLRLVHCLIDPPNAVVGYSALGRQLNTVTSSPKTIATHMTGVRGKFVDVDSSFNAIDSEPGKGYVWRVTP